MSRHLIRAVACAGLLACGSPHGTASRPAAGPVAASPAADQPLAAPPGPTLARWRTHVTDELLPFWTTDAAIGTPPGNFPTFRCNDGTAYRADAPCPEMTDLPPWLSKELGTEYTRMTSRHTFVYGVGYHITGDERLLLHARAGVDWLRRNAYEADTGSAASYIRDGKAGPPPAQRTSQDLAYAQLGLAFYYYLTRDPAVLADLRRLADHVFSTYWEPSWGMLRWVRQDGDGNLAIQQELVSQLDQINAYLLLVAPLLTGDDRAAWTDRLRDLATLIQQRFFAPEHGLFWGTLHDPAQRVLGSRHTDFGHTAKALWMLYLVGELIDDDRMVAFARDHARPLLERAHQSSGCWASGLRNDGTVDTTSQWWIFAELDQLTATLLVAGSDHGDRYRSYLTAGYACWLERFVDHERHGVWPFVPANWTEDMFEERQPIKVFHWKSGYHSMEHALVAMITTAGVTGDALPLYYAFREPPPRETIAPYLFSGTIADTEPHPLPSVPDLRGTKIVFRNIR